MTPADTLRAEAAKRILIKDGAYGTLIQQHRLKSEEYCGGLDLMKDQRGNNDLLNLTRADVVRSICESFAEAGAGGARERGTVHGGIRYRKGKGTVTVQRRLARVNRKGMPPRSPARWPSRRSTARCAARRAPCRSTRAKTASSRGS